MVVPRVSAAVLALICAIFPTIAAAQTPAATVFGCDAPAGRTCYFSLQFAAGGVRHFSLSAGRKMALGGVTAGVDQYQVSVDAPNLGDVNRCRQLIAMGRACVRKVVDAGYND